MGERQVWVFPGEFSGNLSEKMPREFVRRKFLDKMFGGFGENLYVGNDPGKGPVGGRGNVWLSVQDYKSTCSRYGLCQRG